MKHLLITTIAAVLLVGCDRPNIAVIMAADLGCHGAEIAPPNLDALATAGL